MEGKNNEWKLNKKLDIKSPSEIGVDINKKGYQVTKVINGWILKNNEWIIKYKNIKEIKDINEN